MSKKGLCIHPLDPLVIGTDPRILIRIRTKISRGYTAFPQHLFSCFNIFPGHGFFCLTFDDNAGGLLPVVDDLLVERLPRRHAVPQVRHLVLLQVLLNQRPTTVRIKSVPVVGAGPQGCAMTMPKNKSFLQDTIWYYKLKTKYVRNQKLNDQA